jgi:signal transduction histidine kinase
MGGPRSLRRGTVWLFSPGSGPTYKQRDGDLPVRYAPADSATGSELSKRPFASKNQETDPANAAKICRMGTNQAQAAVDFEELLGDLSSSFVRSSIDEIDLEVERWLEKIAMAMGADRSSVFQIDPEGGGVLVTHQWSRPGVTTPDIRGLRTNVAKLYPWAIAKVLSGELVIFSSLDELPPEARRDLASARHVSLKSNVLIPVRAGGAVVGALSVGMVFSERAWSPIEVQRVKLVAEIFGNAFERKRAEAEIHRLSEELRQASHVMTMGELAASLAHELNQPLGAILNNAKAARRLLSAKTPDLIEIDAALDDIIRDDARAVDIVKNVRAMFRRGEARMAPVDVRQLLLEVARIVNGDARMKEISWSLELPDSLPPVLGDKTHLTQAVLNLVVNAFDSVCDAKGPREVAVRADREDPDQVHVSVSDSGKGIDTKLMPSLFEPFYTTKPSGMGMGLTIVRSIIENHGGRIWATQNPVRGATLKFVLPVTRTTPGADTAG